MEVKHNNKEKQQLKDLSLKKLIS